ncbi:glycoside hydrolase family 2 TIM barrel-domain containing protein [Bacteroides graminisolvens]|uniref:glycoside hydrolase family 2 TIM barrel-domain containing protein n=1 Tax=Bacteroides graminisolvens TaxID=477666 RepID=UPI002409F01E|nr:glycoside hydrolase family 2 TIM barrel-domain containing protein [Bacteroides graminisolvens]
MIARLKLFVLVGISICILATGCSQQGSVDLLSRNRLFNTQWKFVRDSVVGAEALSFDDSKWILLDLPHDFSMMDLPGEDTEKQIGPFTKQSPGGNHTGHVLGGTGWYHKVLVTNWKEKGKRFILHFDGVYMESEVWVNGQKMGSHKNGYTPFSYDITSALRQPGQKNLIAVKVNNNGRNSRWYSGSGIYRNVHLFVTDPVHIPLWGAYITTPEISPAQAKVNIALTIRNDNPDDIKTQVIINILDQKGNILSRAEEGVILKTSSDCTLEKQLSVESPSLWSVDNPDLYKAEIILKHSGKIVDVYKQTFGIRTIEFSADKGFLLNGKPILLRGACLHHDNGFLGAAAIKRAEYRRVELMKKNGYNAIRCSHNPPSQAFLDACDELGILVIDEFTDMWNLYKNPNDYSRFFNKHWKNDLTAMLLRDRNHPSIIMWSIGNEIPKMNVKEGIRIGSLLVNKIKQLDGTRAVTEGVPSFLIHGGWKNTKDYFSLLDVCGYNYMRSAYDSDHEQYPNRIMYGSESYPNQAYEYWKAVKDNSYVIGDFVWTAMDYIGEVSVASSKYVKERNTLQLQTRNGIAEGTNPTLIFDMMEKYSVSKWPEYLSWCGDLDIIGEKKPQGRYRDVLWDRSVIEMNVHEPIPDGFIEDLSLWGWPREWSSWTWNGNEGQPLQVRVFTKASQVKLELNGQTIGKKTLSEADKYIATFDVPYQAGKLMAVALTNGKEVGRKELITTGEPKSIKLTVDRETITADRNDLAFVKIEVVDKDGLVVPTSTVKVEITVTGSGELVASGNADPSGINSANKFILNVYRGQAQAIIRPFIEPDDIKVKVKAEGLDSSALLIHVKAIQ